MMHYLRKIDSFLFFCLIFTLSRQLPLNKAPELLSIFTAVFIFFSVIYYSSIVSFSVKKLTMHLGILSLILLLAIFRENAPELTVRFFFILFLINIPLIFNIVNVKYLTWFFLSSKIQSFLLVLAGVIIPVLYTLDSYHVIRQLILSNSWGDVYSYNGIFYRIQIIGSALLPIFFFINYDLYRRTRTSLFWTVFSFVAVIFAGNLAFYLILIFFIFLYEVFVVGKIKLNIRLFIYFFIFTVSIPFVIAYFIELIVLKSAGDTSSLGIRYEQFSLLLANLANSNFAVLFGTGLGNTLDVVTNSRDYTGDIYYELQTIYILNQIGFIPFALYLIFHLYLFFSLIKTKLSLLIYFSYLTYAFVNPYMFDTTHFVVLIIILSYERNLLQIKCKVNGTDLIN